MGRRGFSFGPKRKSYKVGGVKINTKGYRLTSTSVGGKHARVNLSQRGLRGSARVPGTPIRYGGQTGWGRRKRAAGAPGFHQERKWGCLPGCFPVLIIGVIVVVVLVVL